MKRLNLWGVCMALCLIALACGTSQSGKRVSKSEGREKVCVEGLGVLTISEIDGHQYVLFGGFNAGGLVHHNGCPCLEK